MKRMRFVLPAVILAGFLFSQGLLAEAERVIEKEFEVRMGKKLEMDLDAGGDIYITGWDREVVAVTVRIGGKDRDDVEIDFDDRSSGLEIRSDHNKWRRKRRTDIRFEIRVPERFNVSFGTNGGDVVIGNVEGEFRGKTMGGDIELTGLKGKARLTTLGGDVRVEDSELDGKVKTYGGDVIISDVVGDLRGSTLGGDVKYDNVTGRSGKSGNEEVKISSLGGDIDVDYPGRKVRAKTLGGDIDVSEAEEVNVSTLGGDIRVREAPVGAEMSTLGGDITVRSAGKYVKAKTMGGDIEIDAVDGWVRASTMGGDVKVKMVGDPEEGKRDVELKSMGGDIELEVPPGLSMKFDIEIAYTKNSRRSYKIDSDFEMNIERTKKWKSKWGSKRKYIYGTGTAGDGEHLIKIRTTNGNVVIRKGR